MSLDLEPMTMDDTVSKSKREEELIKSSISDGSIVFERITENVYLGGASGLVNNEEYPVCECKVLDDVPLNEHSCGADSGCINRELFIECGDNCPCGVFCQNQRFSRKQNAPMEVFKTDQKGLGLKSNANLRPGSFIIEYCGEVITAKIFKKRVQEYSERNIPHFYFMSLKSNEYIDALKKGNISRYMNHSCNPNCELHKWVVQNHWRIGLFAKREIKEGEELTFDYKFENYGQKQQPCFCGEDNCTGWIGGKKSEKDFSIDEIDSSVNSEDDDDLDSDQFETLADVSKRASKARKKKIKIDSDDEEYMAGKLGPNLKTPIEQSVYYKPGLQSNDDVKNVCRALLFSLKKPQSVSQALNKIEKTDSLSLLRKFLWTHGLQVLKSCISSFIETNPMICLQVLRILRKLPINSKNSSIKIEESVKLLTKVNDLVVSDLAKEVLTSWSDLPMLYKIPKRRLINGESVSQSPSISSLNKFNSDKSTVDNTNSIIDKAEIKSSNDESSYKSKSHIKDNKDIKFESKDNDDFKKKNNDHYQEKNKYYKDYEYDRKNNRNHDRNKIYDREFSRGRDYDRDKLRDKDYDYNRERTNKSYDYEKSIKSYDREYNKDRDYDRTKDRKYNSNKEWDYERSRDRSRDRSYDKDLDRDRGRGRDVDRGRDRDRDRDSSYSEKDYYRDYDYNRSRDRETSRNYEFDGYSRTDTIRDYHNRGYDRDMDYPSKRSRDDKDIYRDNKDFRSRDKEKDRDYYSERRRSYSRSPEPLSSRKPIKSRDNYRNEEHKKRKYSDNNYKSEDVPELSFKTQNKYQDINSRVGGIVVRRTSGQSIEDGEVRRNSKGNNKKDISLKPGWKKAFSNDGKVYYYHEKTRETRWTPPV